MCRQNGFPTRKSSIHKIYQVINRIYTSSFQEKEIYIFWNVGCFKIIFLIKEAIVRHLSSQLSIQKTIFIYLSNYLPVNQQHQSLFWSLGQVIIHCQGQEVDSALETELPTHNQYWIPLNKCIDTYNLSGLGGRLSPGNRAANSQFELESRKNRQR